MSHAPTAASRHVLAGLADLQMEAIGPAAREVARHCTLDWCGVALAGCTEPLAEILLREIVAPERGAEATIVGHPHRATCLTAALANGAISHALDFDDAHVAMSGHPSVPVIPALLALGEREGASGAAFLLALVAGVEVECRLGALVNPPHYLAGWHATGTLGTFGAALACAHLLGLDAEQRLHALGLAGTQAAGLKSAFGSMAKPLHAGRAASAGLLAALLARGGFTANPAVIETEQGFAETHGAGDVDLAGGAAAGDRLHICDVLFKYHAACYLTHAAIEAAGALRRRSACDPADIEAVEVRVSPACVGVCDIAEPRTGLEGKFSLRATTAMALLGDDTSDPELYTTERVQRAALCALRDRVTVTPIAGLPPTCAAVTLRVCGEAHEAEANTGVPETDLARQWVRLSRKFFALASPALGPARAEAVHAAVERLETLESIGELAALLQPGDV